MGDGDKAERQFVNKAWELGWADLRAPGSGSRKRASPDVVAMRENYTHPNGIYKKRQGVKIVCAELKNNKDGTAHFAKREIAELDRWATRAGADAYVGVKPDLRSFDQWFFLPIVNLNETNRGFSLRKSDHSIALGLEDVLDP
jgi:Holliday junction resolvase